MNEYMVILETGAEEVVNQIITIIDGKLEIENANDYPFFDEATVREFSIDHPKSNKDEPLDYFASSGQIMLGYPYGDLDSPEGKAEYQTYKSKIK